MAGIPAPSAALGQRPPVSAWAPLRHRVYRMLWLAQFVSNIGTFMQGIGAVWVMLELRQSPAVVALVQTAAQPVGWSRRRTGAVRWSVLQHAESPGQFVEMFVVPSWDEYVRQQTRHTVADGALDDRLRAFLQPETEPDVAHFLTPPKPHHRSPDQR